MAGTRFTTREQARSEIMALVDYYNRTRRHTTYGMRSPIEFEADTNEDDVA